MGFKKYSTVPLEVVEGEQPEWMKKAEENDKEKEAKSAEDKEEE